MDPIVLPTPVHTVFTPVPTFKDDANGDKGNETCQERVFDQVLRVLGNDKSPHERYLRGFQHNSNQCILCANRPEKPGFAAGTT